MVPCEAGSSSTKSWKFRCGCRVVVLGTCSSVALDSRRTFQKYLMLYFKIRVFLPIGNLWWLGLFGKRVQFLTNAGMGSGVRPFRANLTDPGC